MRLLARDRQARYPAAAAVIDDLARCADHPRDGCGETRALGWGRTAAPLARGARRWSRQ